MNVPNVDKGLFIIKHEFKMISPSRKVDEIVPSQKDRKNDEKQAKDCDRELVAFVSRVINRTCPRKWILDYCDLERWENAKVDDLVSPKQRGKTRLNYYKRTKCFEAKFQKNFYNSSTNVL